MALDPNTPPIGRMPDKVQIAPSRSYPWYGSWRAGRRFTAEQSRDLDKRGIADEAVETILVKRQATHQEMWWPINELPPVFAFDCPVIGHRGDRLKVIAPSGAAKLVQADGWAHRPYRRLRDEWGNPS